MQSVDNTVISASNQVIIDANGDSWAIAGGQVTVNGIADPTTANVIELAYENGLVWQKNADNLWWSKTAVSDVWAPPDGTAVDPIPGQQASADDSIVTVVPGQPTASIVDASGNAWSILNGQVTLNAIEDNKTANVIALGYVNGLVWQENADHLWWSKSKPSDQWGPQYGTPDDPLLGVTRSWIGGTGTFDTASGWTPSGIPQAGDTARVAVGTVEVTPGFGNGVNLDLQGGSLRFDESGTFATGSWSGSGSLLVGYPGQTVSVTTTGIHLAGSQLVVDQFISTGASWAVEGDSSVTAGAALVTQLVGTASLPNAPLRNDGVLTVDNAELRVGVLEGSGVVRATGNSTVSVISAGADETIQLVSGHLSVGGGVIQTSTALQFLAPVTEFGDSSSITLNRTQATLEVFASSGQTAGELFLYDGSNLVADLRISGQAQIYASDIQGGSSQGAVLLTGYDTGHSIPIISV